MNKFLYGYIWYISLVDSDYIPSEEVFDTKEEAFNDGISYGYSEDYIWVNSVEFDGECTTILDTCVRPKEIFYIDDEFN